MYCLYIRPSFSEKQRLYFKANVLHLVFRRQSADVLRRQWPNTEKRSENWEDISLNLFITLDY